MNGTLTVNGEEYHWLFVLVNGEHWMLRVQGKRNGVTVTYQQVIDKPFTKRNATRSFVESSRALQKILHWGKPMTLKEAL